MEAAKDRLIWRTWGKISAKLLYNNKTKQEKRQCRLLAELRLLYTNQHVFILQKGHSVSWKSLMKTGKTIRLQGTHVLAVREK